MNVQAKAKYIHMSPRKTRLVVNLIRGMEIEEARKQLKFSLKAAAEPILKVLNSAVANAENNFKLDTTNYIVTEATINDGPTMMRFRPRAQGRAAPIRKRMSHITISVGPKAGTEVNAVKEEKEVKVEKPATKKVAPKAKKETAKKVATKS